MKLARKILCGFEHHTCVQKFHWKIQCSKQMVAMNNSHKSRQPKFLPSSCSGSFEFWTPPMLNVPSNVYREKFLLAWLHDEILRIPRNVRTWQDLRDGIPNRFLPTYRILKIVSNFLLTFQLCRSKSYVSKPTALVSPRLHWTSF